MAKSIKFENDIYISPEAIGGYIGFTDKTMDNLKVTGFYYVYNSTNPTLPFGSAGYVLVLARSSSYAKQFYSPYNSNWIYTRTCDNGIWTNWQYLSFGG